LLAGCLAHFDAKAAELENEIDSAEAGRKEAYDALTEARGGVGRGVALANLQAQHKAACKTVRDLKQSSKKADDTTPLISSVRKLIDDLNGYLKKNQGGYNMMLESVISNTPISAKHNPFYKGAFNGNDCFRLIANHDLISRH
jgi:hypothetical protein